MTATLKKLVRGNDGNRLRLGDLVDEVEEDDGPGPVLFVLTLPVLAPTPPGVSMLLALPLLLVTPQIVVGRQRLWIPNGVANRTIDRKGVAKVVRRVTPPLTRLERLLKPRLKFLTGRIGARFVGVAATAIAVVLVLPIPAANLVPSLALVLFALGLSRRDGLFVLAGYALMLIAALVVWLAVVGIRLGVGGLHF